MRCLAAVGCRPTPLILLGLQDNTVEDITCVLYRHGRFLTLLPPPLILSFWCVLFRCGAALGLQDNTAEDITCVLYDALDFIEGVRRSHGRVFVHCAQGVSRSTSLVIAYLMWSQVSCGPPFLPVQ